MGLRDWHTKKMGIPHKKVEIPRKKKNNFFEFSSKIEGMARKNKKLLTLFLSKLAINKLTAKIISNSHHNIKTLKLILI